MLVSTPPRTRRSPMYWVGQSSSMRQGRRRASDPSSMVMTVLAVLALVIIAGLG
ncbi:MAG: hypothetical protein ABGZ36_04810 [Actinomycetota bacterium]